MSIFDKLFDKLDLDEEPAKEEKETKEQKKHRERNSKDKEKLKDEKTKEEELSKRYFEKCTEVDKLKKTIEDLKVKNTIYVNLENSDDRKKLKELIEEGKVLLSKNQPFIVADVPVFGVNNLKPVTHTIYCNDVIQADYRIYYLDLTMMPKGSRTKAYERIWLQHKGYSSYDLITKEQLEYLLNNGYLKKVNYSHIDMSLGVSFNTDDDSEPDDDFIRNQMDKYNADLSKLRNSSSTNIDKQKEE